jgi:Spy/CpxP family protein refolding chaperone
MMGPPAMFEVALHDLDLSDAQRSTIESTLESLRPPERAAKPDHEKRSQALAAAIRTGKIDAAALTPSDAEGDAVHKEMHAKMTAALTTLHDTLTADQRKTLVARLRERHPGRDRGDPPKGRRPGGHLEMMLHGVDISDEQRVAIEKALADARIDMAPPLPPDGGKGPDLLFDAFVADSFDASALPTPVHRRPPFVETLAVVVPILDADQHNQLADAILEGPPKRFKHHH